MTPLGSQAPVVGPGWPLPPPPWGLLRCVSSPCPWGRDITCLSKMPPEGQSDLSWAIPLSNSTPNLSANPKDSSYKSTPCQLLPAGYRVPLTPSQASHLLPRHQTRSPEWISLPQPPAWSSIPRSSQSIFPNQVKSHQPSTQTLHGPFLPRVTRKFSVFHH